MRLRAGHCLLSLLTAVVVSSVASPLSAAAAEGPGWLITSQAQPAYFAPGATADQYKVIATNIGSLPTGKEKVAIANTLPPGVTATKIVGEDENTLVLEGHELTCELTNLTCETEAGQPVGVGDLLIVTITVAVHPDAFGSEPNSARISGGGAAEASVSSTTPIRTTRVPYGASAFVASFTGADGTQQTQAGSHPFQMTTAFALTVGSLDSVGNPELTADPKDINVALPPGLLGNPIAVPQCSQAEFQQSTGNFPCPADTQVGIISLFFYGGRTAVQTGSVYNIAPPPGYPAELGFAVAGLTHEAMLFRVHPEGDRRYRLTADISNLTETDPVQAGILTLWGVPADSRHDAERFGSNGAPGAPSGVTQRPFLTYPTGCHSGPLTASLYTDSWQSPQSLESPLPTGALARMSTMPVPTGCEDLSFNPSIDVQPNDPQAGAPSGYTMDFHVPQNEDPTGLGTPDLKAATVVFPQGTTISLPSADGLQGCSDNPNDSAGDQFGLTSATPASCPAASRVGTVRISTPLLSNPLEGEVFLGKPMCGPCALYDVQHGKLFRLFAQAEGSGVSVKVEGSASLNQDTGQLTATFDNSPQLPFGDLELTLKSGARAPLANPSTCGTPLVATSQMIPYGTEVPAEPSSEPFEVTGCPLPRFSPAFNAGTMSNQAGGFSPMTFTVTRTDQEEDLAAITLDMPGGLLGVLSSVPRCPDAQASTATCGAASRIGGLTVGVGPGGDPLFVRGDAYLTGPYEGAPFGLAFVIHAVAGPFDLGDVIVRSAIYVDPHTGALTVRSDSLPQTLDGIPLHIRVLNLTVDREGFMFNTTSCRPLTIEGTATSTHGSTSFTPVHYQAANCATLPFAPKLNALSAARTTKRNGARLHLTLISGPGQANIAKLKVDLPKQLPSRLTTLQKACPGAVFNANPASCPAASVVGTGTARTPVLSQPLTGPAYLVSHGGVAFPDLDILLQGEGVTINLEGQTNIKGGVTSSTFKAVPDAPLSRFDIVFPEGRYSMLGATGNLCKTALKMPTVLTGQNGAVVKQTTKIAVSGCPKRRAKKASSGKARNRSDARAQAGRQRLESRPTVRR